MLIKKTLSIVALCAFSATAFSVEHISAEDRWNSLPEEKQMRITEKAAELGIDVTTTEGRLAFREARKANRAARAAELGFDISTPEGKRAFHTAKHERRHARHDAIKDQVSELTVEDRTALREELNGLSRSEKREVLAARFSTVN